MCYTILVSITSPGSPVVFEQSFLRLCDLLQLTRRLCQTYQARGRVYIMFADLHEDLF